MLLNPAVADSANPILLPSCHLFRPCNQKTTTGGEIRIQFYSLDCCSKEENCFAVCKSSFCSSRQRTFFYTTSQVLCELLI